MSRREIAKKITPLPLVDLDFISQPSDGKMVKVNSTCKKAFLVGSKCIDHYKSLAFNAVPNKIVPCPFGFSSYCFKVQERSFAFSCIIPFPRTGVNNEARLAKKYPETKCSLDLLNSYSDFISSIFKDLNDAEKETARKYTMAFHEIRKLNRNIKQQTERLYQSTTFPNESELRKKHETIFRSAEMLSAQFEIIEVLADESLAALPLKAKSELYRIFHKCVLMYQTTPPQIILECNQNYHPQAMTCDKTFPIIPTVLIENALKYSLPRAQIVIKFESSDKYCTIRVSNETELEKPIDSSILMKGIRGSHQTEGSGMGLYLAQIVARQHNTQIEVSCVKLFEKRYRCTFSIRFALLTTNEP